MPLYNQVAILDAARNAERLESATVRVLRLEQELAEARSNLLVGPPGAAVLRGTLVDQQSLAYSATASTTPKMNTSYLPGRHLPSLIQSGQQIHSQAGPLALGGLQGIASRANLLTLSNELVQKPACAEPARKKVKHYHTALRDERTVNPVAVSEKDALIANAISKYMAKDGAKSPGTQIDRKKAALPDEGSESSKSVISGEGGTATGRFRFNNDRWHQMYAELLDYKKMYGDCMVPRSFQPNPKLGRWVNTQRAYRTFLIASQVLI